MSTFWSIVKRETDERRLLMLGALALGFLPFAVALIPTQLGADIGEARLELAIILAGVATGVTALFLGSSVIARDLAERRLSFYFSRPVPPWMIWGGKMTAAVGLSLATGFLIVLPTLLTGARPVDGLPPAWLVQGAAAALLAIVGLAHALSVLLRTRSPWLLLDLGAALAVTLIVLAARGHLVRLGISETPVGPTSVLVQGYRALAVVGILAALAAGAVQVAVGRTDPRRSHKALSLTLWSLLLPASLLFLGFSRWVTKVEPRDLETIGSTAVAAPAGPWVLLGGPARHRSGFSPMFLFDTSTGRAVRIDAHSTPTPSGARYSLLFSRDGRRAAWLEPQPLRTLQLMTLDLTSPASRPLAALVSFQGKPLDFALSADGTRLATVEGNRLLVHGLPRGELLASAALPKTAGSFGYLEFDGPGHVQLVQQNLDADRHEETVVRYRLDIATRKMTREDIGRGGFESWLEVRMPLGRHTLWFETKAAGVELIIGDRAGVEQRRVFFPRGKAFQLPGGRMVFSRAKTLQLGGQPAADQVVVWTGEFPLGWGARDVDLFLLDLAKGTLRPLSRGLWPIGMAESAEVGAPATRLFFNETELVRIDPETGRKTTVLELS